MSLRVFSVLAGLVVLASTAVAQTNRDVTPTPTPPQSPTTPTVDSTDPTTSRIISSPEVKENLASDSVTSPTRPSTGTARTALSTEVKDRLRTFERAREAYLQKQRELERRLKGATDAERERIREQLKDRRAAWLEQHKQFQAELRERLRDIKREIPSLRSALDESRPTRPGLD
jgi:flagellar motility protein MotE (MotC chaperone)